MSETKVDAQRAKEYARWKRKLWLLDLVVTLGLLWGVLASGIAQRLSPWVESRVGAALFQVALYVFILGGAATVLTLPLDWIRGFYLEHRFQLSTQNFSQWLWEQAKQMMVGGALGLILVEVLSSLIRGNPAIWWMWAALFWLGWSVVLARLFPTLLIPIFYRQRILPDKALAQRLEKFLSSRGARVAGIFEINLSRTTRKANACLTGLGKTRRVLLSDTLVADYPPQEIEVVLAHELGHHRHRHIGILIGVSSLFAGLGFFLVDRVVSLWLASLGIAGMGTLAALPAIGLGLFLFQFLSMPVIHGVSRRLEAQADLFALKSTEDPQAFIEVMRRLAKQNLAEMNPPRWAEWLLYDHPPIAKRIAMAQAYRGRS